MLEIFNNVKDTVSELIEILTTMINSCSSLILTIDSITFDSTNLIYSFFSTLRYVIGDVLYTTITGLIIIGMTFMLYQFIKRIINFVLGFVPFINVRIP